MKLRLHESIRKILALLSLQNNDCSTVPNLLNLFPYLRSHSALRHKHSHEENYDSSRNSVEKKKIHHWFEWYLVRWVIRLAVKELSCRHDPGSFVFVDYGFAQLFIAIYRAYLNCKSFIWLFYISLSRRLNEVRRGVVDTLCLRMKTSFRQKLVLLHKTTLIKISSIIIISCYVDRRQHNTTRAHSTWMTF